MSTVEKAISLLNFFTEEEPEWGLSEIARQAQFDKATTRRLLVALASCGLVEQHTVTRRYQLGAGLLRLARVRESHFPLLQVAVPIIRDVATSTNETVHLSEFGARGLVTVHVEESTKANRVSVAAGQLLPLHATASGIAFLACSPPELVRSCLRKSLTAFTRHTLVQPKRLQDAITAAAAQGYSRGEQGFEDGVFSVAAPILGLDGFALGSVAVAMPLSRSTKATTDRHIQAVRNASEKIATRLFGELPTPKHASFA
ncbi:IclR family transcriptional regulator [Bradyrhizobium manausense]|uniref:IclR family transcriptional regulator n=1 Tax=Bradyrhizobium manausense TaxID=989370 RepID=UPI001BA55886|nr:IclR family transcriptional regulator [Bradyrhizobium manausense]MBR0725533.1 IclR family transcriptional regulator [Bradyrhizobium manausense]MBR0834196.1 IclR family transcriptional regulator [Bradyrhizobium manausense]